MKKFSFAFERAMDWREKQAERERQELHRLNAVLSSLESRQGEVAMQLKETSSALAGSAKFSGADLRMTAAFLTSLRSSAEQLKALESHCQAEIQTQTGRCVSADCDFKLLAKLREQRLAGWQYEYNRESEQVSTEIWQAGRR